MPSSSMLHVRIDDDVKDRATQALEAMGMTVSSAVKLFLTRVAVEQAIPFVVKVPNAESRAAIAEIEEKIAKRRADHLNTDGLDDVLDGGKS